MIRASMFFVLVVGWACSSSPTQIEKNDKSMAESIVDSAIAFYTTSPIEECVISFDFRKKRYGVEWPQAGVHYYNTYADSLGMHERHLNTGVYSETINGNVINLDVKTIVSRSSSLNSVLYFALLPLHLRDPAVQVKDLGEESIKGVNYHKVQVTFIEEGVGDDFDDTFLYWFDTEDYSMDYLAYSYIEDEGGTRFREAKNTRRINGIIFQDYFNYKGPNLPDSLKYISQLYQEGKLQLLSEINLEQIHVEQLN